MPQESQLWKCSDPDVAKFFPTLCSWSLLKHFRLLIFLGLNQLNYNHGQKNLAPESKNKLTEGASVLKEIFSQLKYIVTHEIDLGAFPLKPSHFDKLTQILNQPLMKKESH